MLSHSLLVVFLLALPEHKLHHPGKDGEVDTVLALDGHIADAERIMEGMRVRNEGGRIKSEESGG